MLQQSLIYLLTNKFWYQNKNQIQLFHFLIFTLKNMNPLQRQQLRLTYNRLHNKKFINVDELRRASEYVNNKLPSHRQPNRLLSHALRNRKESNGSTTDEYINYEKLQKRINDLMSPEEKNDSTTRELVFEMLDHDKDGVISKEDLMVFLRSVGSTMDQEQVQELLELMTPEGSHLSKKQFLQIMEYL